ncbi:unnamed protein product [Ectocarpus fasciculatus]
MDYAQFNLNTGPAEAYATDAERGAAIVVTNTGVVDGNTTVAMGEFNDMYCFGNDPYECEFVYDQSDIVHGGVVSCQICDIDGVRQVVSDTDDDSAERSFNQTSSSDSVQQGSSTDNDLDTGSIDQTSSSSSVQQGSDTDDDLDTGTIDQSSSSNLWDSKGYIIIGLSAAVACASSWQSVFL